MLLPWLILIPFISGILCLVFRYNQKINMPRNISIISIFIELYIFITKIVYNNFYYVKNCFVLKYNFFQSWIPRFGISFNFNIDGVSMLMCFLTFLLGFIAILCSSNEKQKNQSFLYSSIMFIIGSLLGIFLSLDMFLFFIFWEIMIIPIYFLIIFYNSTNYNNNIKNNVFYTAQKFFLYNQLSGILMLVSIISLAYLNNKINGIWSFNYHELIKLHLHMSYSIELILMILLFISFAIKLPIIFLHTWLPDTHLKLPKSGAIDLIAIMIKTSVYGLLKFSIVLFPRTSHDFSFIAIIIGLMTILYHAFVAFNQKDIKKIISYSSISHTGYALIAVYSDNKTALLGVVLYIISHSISSSGLLIICGQLHRRFFTRNINKFQKGIWNKINWIPGMFLFFSLANLGIPGTGNFIGEFMILNGGFNKHPTLVTIASLSLIFSSIYHLMMIKKICYIGGEENKNVSNTTINNTKINFKEIFVIFILAFFTLLIGLFPGFFIKIIFSTIYNLNSSL